MIRGIGLDMIELSRIRRNIERDSGLIERVLTDKEQDKLHSFTSISRKTEFLAGRFAAKEAFAKAVGTGIGDLSFHDIEVLTGSAGAPEITVKGYDDVHVFISITHTKEYAAAQVVIEEVVQKLR
ncbi:holo-ACP synthase [Lentibacillus sp. L22]|uniref:holo-ACP synthase n=1 Tax=Lentibacillus TaxID=175304 RepID=UPI0022B1CF60|nr:holo-ACP synthase [Lentibacillus daqui]